MNEPSLPGRLFRLYKMPVNCDFYQPCTSFSRIKDSSPVNASQAIIASPRTTINGIIGISDNISLAIASSQALPFSGNTLLNLYGNTINHVTPPFRKSKLPSAELVALFAGRPSFVSLITAFLPRSLRGHNPTTHHIVSDVFFFVKIKLDLQGRIG